VANVKGYLGGFATANQEHDVDEVRTCSDLSTLGGSLALESSTMTTSTTTTTTTADHRSINGCSSSPMTTMTTERPSPRFPSVLIEIPENFPRDLPNEQPNEGRDVHNHKAYLASLEDDFQVEESASVTHSKTTNCKLFYHERPNRKDDSSAILEIKNNLFDMDSYLLSVYMTEDASIYTMATTSNGSSSSGSSISSTVSTRRRHRGAHHNRRRDCNQAQKLKGTWLDTMRESSNNVCLEGGEGWTPLRGWSIPPKKAVEIETDDRCVQIRKCRK
jgi:hypothetical protein